MSDFRTAWHERLKKVVQQGIRARTFAAFNANVDVIVHLDDGVVQRLLRDSGVSLSRVRARSAEALERIVNPEDFFTVLRDRLIAGKSFHITVDSSDLFTWLDDHFQNEKETMGGQAGIIANQMAELGAPALVYTPVLSPKQARLFHPDVRTPVISDTGELELVPAAAAARAGIGTKINWILEYGKGLVFHFGEETVTTPRANRVILASRPREAVMGFPPQLRPFLTDLAACMDVAFMAGYHYASHELPDGRSFAEYLADSVADLRALKAGNPQLRIHLEYVPMQDPELERKMLLGVGREISSFGINENEIRRVLREFGYEEEARRVEEAESAYTLYRGALALAGELGLDRIQVHNLGYYVLVLRKPYPVPAEEVRNACLYGSCVNALKARDGGYVRGDCVYQAAEIPLSDIGFTNLETLARDLGLSGQAQEAFLAQGILEEEDHILVAVPAHVVPNPVSTVGMGDTISSSSYARELQPLPVC
ncbi:MAG TPA: hypothetical protein GXX55_02115 [Firmicutes bacterium]|nr:hypothetical protein [Bacillota bacterium]